MSDGTPAPSTTPPATDASAPVLGGPAVPANGALGSQTPDATKPAVTAEGTKPPDAEADKKALEAKQADEKKAAEAEFEKSWTDFKPKLPEGVTLDEASLKEFTPLAKELGLKPEQAQKLVDLQVKTAAARQASETKARDDGLKTERDGWLKDLKADKDLGGTKWDDTLRVANKAFEKFADPALRQFLQATGLDAHPGLVRSFHKIGLALKDDSIAGSSSTGAGAPSAEAINAQLYPSMQPKS